MTDPDKRLVQVTITIKGGANIRVEGEDPAIITEYLAMDEDELLALVVSKLLGGQVDNDSEAVVD